MLPIISIAPFSPYLPIVLGIIIVKASFYKRQKAKG